VAECRLPDYEFAFDRTSWCELHQGGSTPWMLGPSKINQPTRSLGGAMVVSPEFAGLVPNLTLYECPSVRLGGKA